MEDFSTAAIVISICALVATFYESLQTRRSFREQTYQGFIDTWFELGQIFIERPELRRYFYDNHPLSEDDENYERVIAVAEYCDDCFAYAESQAKNIPAELRRSYDVYKARIQSMHAFQAYRERYIWVNSRTDAER